MDTAFQRALNRYLRTGKLTAREAARQLGVTPSHIRAVARGDRHLPHPKVETLSSWLVDELGLTEHVEGMLGMSGAVHFHPDQVEDHDCLHDEMAMAQKHLADADRALKDGRRGEAMKEAQKAVREGKEAIADIRSAPD
jgi:transcriptional regulator with XRE-family HTH domain